MLLQFNFENYKSFRDSTSLDMTAVKISEHTDRVVSIAGEKVLPCAAIFGANASGKSNVLDALAFMMRYVIESYAYGDEMEALKTNRQVVKAKPFLFDEKSKAEPSSFEVFFAVGEKQGNKVYNYGFVLDEEEVLEEWLNVKAKTSKDSRQLFYRDRESVEGKVELKKLKNALSKEALLLSVGAKLQNEDCKRVRDFFYQIEILRDEDGVQQALQNRFIPQNLYSNVSFQKNLLSFLQSFEPSIKNLDFHSKRNPAGDVEKLEVFTGHQDVVDGTVQKLPLEEESDGTLKMFALYPALAQVLEKGGVLCVDELNSRLHPLLLRTILLLFLNPESNPKHAQLIFTTHDAWQLSTQLLRRDEVWFCEKDRTGVSSLYSLADFIDEEGQKIRKDESLEKNYLLGKYGAIPRLQTFQALEENHG